MRRVRLAIVDDSSFVRRAIPRMLSDEPRIRIVGTAASGEELLANLQEWMPDVITLDLSMPGIGGLLTLDHIMSMRPTPVIILSTHAGKGAPQTIEALHRGAADFIDKQQYSLIDFQRLRGVLVEKLLAVAGPAAGQEEAASEAEETFEEPESIPLPALRADYDVVLIGASTGGPLAIQRVLEDLGTSPPTPIVAVQHMPKEFIGAFVHRLDAHLPLEVHLADHDSQLLDGCVYVAPGGLHLRLAKRGETLISQLSRRPEDAVHRPSVDELFASAAETLGGRAIAVLLTGMGRDGADGMLRLAEAGAYTLAQDRDSSVVYGMPGAAARLQAVREILPLAALGERVRDLLGLQDPAEAASVGKPPNRRLSPRRQQAKPPD